jgi:hypothetical protein
MASITKHDWTAADARPHGLRHYARERDDHDHFPSREQFVLELHRDFHDAMFAEIAAACAVLERDRNAALPSARRAFESRRARGLSPVAAGQRVSEGIASHDEFVDGERDVERMPRSSHQPILDFISSNSKEAFAAPSDRDSPAVNGPVARCY